MGARYLNVRALLCFWHRGCRARPWGEKTILLIDGGQPARFLESAVTERANTCVADACAKKVRTHARADFSLRANVRVGVRRRRLGDRGGTGRLVGVARAYGHNGGLLSCTFNGPPSFVLAPGGQLTGACVCVSVCSCARVCAFVCKHECFAIILDLRKLLFTN